MKTKAQLEYSLKWLEVDLKNAKTKSDIAKVEKKIKDIKAQIAKKGGRKPRRGTRRGTRRN
jgi:peptidoglycan hydrolase CwlO-like protein